MSKDHPMAKYQDPSRRVQELKVWQCTDGSTFKTPMQATDHQEMLDFRQWCQENICAGGEWSADMVATAVLEAWMVRPR